MENKTNKQKTVWTEGIQRTCLWILFFLSICPLAISPLTPPQCLHMPLIACLAEACFSILVPIHLLLCFFLCAYKALIKEVNLSEVYL